MASSNQSHLPDEEFTLTMILKERDGGLSLEACPKHGSSSPPLHSQKCGAEDGGRRGGGGDSLGHLDTAFWLMQTVLSPFSFSPASEDVQHEGKQCTYFLKKHGF